MRFIKGLSGPKSQIIEQEKYQTSIFLAIDGILAVKVRGRKVFLDKLEEEAYITLKRTQSVAYEYLNLNFTEV